MRKVFGGLACLPPVLYLLGALMGLAGQSWAGAMLFSIGAMPLFACAVVTGFVWFTAQWQRADGAAKVLTAALVLDAVAAVVWTLWMLLQGLALVGI